MTFDEFVTNICGSCSGLTISFEHEQDLKKLIDEHNTKIIKLTGGIYTILRIQITNDVSDIYTKIHNYINRTNKNDSSSLKFFVLKYGDVVGEKLYKERRKISSCQFRYLYQKVWHRYWSDKI